MRLRDAHTAPRNPDAHPGRRIVLATGDAPGLRSLEAPPSAVLALVGPAGGFDPRELAELDRAGVAPVSLGPRVLRAETGAVATVAALQLLWGDMA